MEDYMPFDLDYEALRELFDELDPEDMEDVYLDA